jgi:hypothetical protein
MSENISSIQDEKRKKIQQYGSEKEKRFRYRNREKKKDSDIGIGKRKEDSGI